MKPLLIVVCGDSSPRLPPELGGYDRWFARILDVPTHTADPRVGPLPDPSGYRGVVVSGSTSGVHEELPWMRAAAAWLLACDLPTLGVCFGHQLLAWAHGGVVRPATPEYGVHDVDRLEDDPLFEGLGDRFPVFECHFDAVVQLPENARVLAGNANAVQALAFGPRVRSVQFHPEFTPQVVADALDRHQEALEALVPGLPARGRAGLREIPEATLILTNFLKYFVKD